MSILLGSFDEDLKRLEEGDPDPFFDIIPNILKRKYLPPEKSNYN